MGPSCSNRMIAEAEGRFFGPAIVTALARLQAQITTSRRTARARATLATRALQA
jgi:hypothetical protein